MLGHVIVVDVSLLFIQNLGEITTNPKQIKRNNKCGRCFLNQCLIMVVRQISSESIVQVALEKLQRVAEHIYRAGVAEWMELVLHNGYS
jgi:hypothetical protein